MDEKKIAHLMKTLDLSRDEAIALIRDDENDVSVDLTAEQKQVVKEMTRSDRKKEMTTRKRERKIDEDKRAILAQIAVALERDTDNLTITNPEREIEFSFLGNRYSITLIKHRKEKVK